MVIAYYTTNWIFSESTSGDDVIGGRGDIDIHANNDRTF
jgi:hypothetical protein